MIQGAFTRAVTPRLPEPPGSRSGRTGTGPSLRLLIAGDSAAAGVGVTHQSAALSGQLVAALEPHVDLQWQLIATSGFTTRELVHRLKREAPRPFDVAVISLGVNDVTSAVRVSTWLKRQRELAALLAQRFGVQRIILSSLPPMHELTALPQPLRWMLGARSRRFNMALARAVADMPGCEVLQLVLPQQSESLAPDGFHPGRATYQNWATELTVQIMRVDLQRPLPMSAHTDKLMSPPATEPEPPTPRARFRARPGWGRRRPSRGAACPRCSAPRSRAPWTSRRMPGRARRAA